MRSLTANPDASLWRGDIVRLVHDYDLGPRSGPVDLMVYDPMDHACGLGVIVVSGYKAGHVLSVFPKDSCGAKQRSLEAAWLIANWNNWFCYTYERNGGDLVPLPIEGTMLIGWDEREIVVQS